MRRRDFISALVGAVILPRTIFPFDKLRAGPFDKAQGKPRRKTLREQWEDLTAAQLEVARWLWDRGPSTALRQPFDNPSTSSGRRLRATSQGDGSGQALGRTLVALGWQESSLGVELWNVEDDEQWSGSAGVLGVGVKWATIREHGPDFTQEQWDETKRRLIDDREYCLRQALVQLERGRRKFGNVWWRVWAYYNGGDNWRKPQAQAYARQVYRRWLAVGSGRP